jgi:DNA-binding MarR family transcriptional regulator
MVDRLQEAELAERRSDAADRRSWNLFLTPRAHVLLAQLRPLANEMVEEALEGFDATERETLQRLIEKLRVNLTRRGVEVVAAHG